MIWYIVTAMMLLSIPYMPYMADDLQGGSEILGFQEDSVTKGGLVNKRNTKLHANMKILWFSA